MVPGEDSRNIAGFQVVVVVSDVQDTPPVWDHIDPLTVLPANLTQVHFSTCGLVDFTLVILKCLSIILYFVLYRKIVILKVIKSVTKIAKHSPVSRVHQACSKNHLFFTT